MASHSRGSNIVIDVPEDVTIENISPSATKRGTRKPLPKGPIPLPEVGGSPVGEDLIVSAMRAQDLVLVDSFDMISTAPRGVRAAPAPSHLTIDVDENEDAAILLEQDGIYSWRYGAGAATVESATTRRGPVSVRPKRRVTFDLSVEPTPTPAGRRQRGPVTDFVFGKVRTYVFRFVSRIAVQSAIGFLERKKRTGLVHVNGDDPTSWSPIERLDALALPSDRPARILLLVHGTFSSTVGSFGALGVSEWGRAFLVRTRASYDAVIGYDHCTLSCDPLQNAADMLGRLEHTTAPSLLIDAVAFSRGALVLRSMIEFLLPSASIRARVRRAVFVGGTNDGTKLAVKENWNLLIDVTTNLVSVGCRAISLFAPAALAATIVRESIDTLGALVKCLTTQILSDDAVPGLAAMVPKGRFVTEINKTQPGQPRAADSLYFVVSSDFDAQGIVGGKVESEFPVRLAQWAANVVSDAVIGESNDLVVDNASMTAIDVNAGTFVKDRLHFKSNPHVYHTIYFTREEVVRALTRWFQLDPAAPGATAGDAVTAGADDRIVVVDATEPLKAALNAIKSSGPTFVIAERRAQSGNRLRYAIRSEELINVGKRLGSAGQTRSLESAVQGTPLEMHESTPTYEAAAESISSTEAFSGSTGERSILVVGDVTRAVVEGGASMASNSDLANVSKRAVGLRAKGGIDLSPSRAPAELSRARGGRRVTRSTTSGATTPEKAPAPVGEDALESVTRSRSLAPGVDIESPLARPKTGSVYMAADMPESIPVNTSVSLSVVVCQDEIVVTSGPTQRTAKAKVALDRPAVVQVVAKRNVEIVTHNEGDDRATIDPNDPRTELVFDVKGIASGPGEIWVLLMQGPIARVTIKLFPRVEPGPEPASRARASAAGEAQPAEIDTCKYPLLQIFEWQANGAFKYHFVLEVSPGNYISDYSAEIKRPRDDYVAEIYKQIETRWTNTKGEEKEFDNFQEELRTYGCTLLDELVPSKVHNALWKVRDTLKSIQVVAEEPFIPWELVHLKPPPDENGKPAPLPDQYHFLAQKGLVRWLHNRGVAPAQLTIGKGRSYYVIPKYPHPEYELPEAQDEIPYLQSAFGAMEVDAEAGAIRDLLRTPGQVQHFHFSGHGEADAKTAVDAQLMLRGTIENGSWVPRYLQADLVAQHARLEGTGGAKALVVLNACQVGRAGWRLSSIGGFAESFIRAGAGIFVGTLWSVGDAPARNFSEAFYKALLSGRTLAEATTAGRDAARAANEATWLAYVVYGYPCAKLTVETPNAGAKTGGST
jgi:hypothetical protein